MRRWQVAVLAVLALVALGCEGAASQPTGPQLDQAQGRPAHLDGGARRLDHGRVRQLRDAAGLRAQLVVDRDGVRDRQPLPADPRRQRPDQRARAQLRGAGCAGRRPRAAGGRGGAGEGRLRDDPDRGQRRLHRHGRRHDARPATFRERGRRRAEGAQEGPAQGARCWWSACPTSTGCGSWATATPTPYGPGSWASARACSPTPTSTAPADQAPPAEGRRPDRRLRRPVGGGLQGVREALPLGPRGGARGPVLAVAGQSPRLLPPGRRRAEAPGRRDLPGHASTGERPAGRRPGRRPRS